MDRRRKSQSVRVDCGSFATGIASVGAGVSSRTSGRHAIASAKKNWERMNKNPLPEVVVFLPNSKKSVESGESASEKNPSISVTVILYLIA